MSEVRIYSPEIGEIEDKARETVYKAEMSRKPKRYIEVSNLPNLECVCTNGNKYVLLPYEHLSDIPFADVAEVVHGYWKDTEYGTCSVCGRSIDEIYDADSSMSTGILSELSACPFCGAKMDYIEEVEICPYCDQENVYPMWNNQEQGFVATCQHCGEEILLCDACQHTVCEDGETHDCDWRETDCGGKCHRGETTRKECK